MQVSEPKPLSPAIKAVAQQYDPAWQWTVKGDGSVEVATGDGRVLQTLTAAMVRAIEQDFREDRVI
jgi:hypothetical protein